MEDYFNSELEIDSIVYMFLAHMLFKSFDNQELITISEDVSDLHTD